jgi:uncharacterized protein (TIGR02231 family)
MRTLLALTVPALLAAPALAADVLVASKISRVTVYSDRALVERTAVAQVPGGTSRILLPGFPAGFDPNSLRARSSQVKVLGVDTERVHLSREANAEAEAARKAWDAARRVTAEAEMELADAKDAWDRLKSLRAAALQKGGDALAGQAVDVGGIDKMLGLVDERGKAARARILGAQTAVEDAKAAEDAAKRRMDELASARQRVETRVVVTVSSESSAQATVSVEYMMGNAGWTPVYDVRVSEDFASAALEMNAVVAQRTGEDWQGIPMELTTAQPSAGAAPPEPSAWEIDLMREPPAGGLVAERAAQAPAKGRLARDEEAKDAGFAMPVRRSGVVVAFASAAPASVATDGQPSRVAIGRFDLPPQVRWVAFPRATDKVFVSAKLKNTAGSPLPAGEARVFVGPDYVGPMELADWGQDKEVDVGLGVDREVEVARETLKQERSTEGVFSKDTVHERAYRITLKNHRDRPVDVRLLDQVPVSHDEELKVEITENSVALAKLPPREEETNKARGVLEWRLGVGAKQETDLRFAWRVAHPRGRTLVGFDE